jgi:thiamine-phosphate diphosphorylase
MLPRLHIITDTTLQSRYSHYELAEMAFAAGAVAVQYRNKHYRAERDLDELMRIAALARRSGRVLIVNDNVQLAFQVGAHGVHLGREDAPPEQARALLGPGAIVGATVHDRAELDALKGQSLDYIGVGPVFGTQSKATGLPMLGLAGLRDLCAVSPWPVIAIGGIGPDGIGAVTEAGAYGCAVISAFCKSEDPKNSARQMLEILGKV